MVQKPDPAELQATIEKLNQEINKLTGEVAHYKAANEQTIQKSLEMIQFERRKVELLSKWIMTTYRVDTVPDFQDLLKVKL